MTEDRSDYLLHRIRRAFETLHEAELLLNSGMIAGSVNRIYYACFYAVSALLTSEGHFSARHGGVMSLFDQHWIKPGRMPKEVGAFYHLIFNRRQKSDYEDLLPCDPGKAAEWLTEARSLVERAADWLRTNAGVDV